MAETPNQTPEPVTITEPELEEVPQTRLQSFVNKHPKAARLLAITGAVGTVAGAVHFTRTLHANKDHLELAGDHAKEALNELSTSTSPNPDAEA